MSTIKISQLPIGTPSGNNIFPFVQSGVTKQGYISGITGSAGVIVEGQGTDSSVRDGLNNNAFGNCSAVLGGDFNTSCNNYSVVTGGYKNSAEVDCSFVGGGVCNTISSGYQSSIVGGFQILYHLTIHLSVVVETILSVVVREQ